MVFFCNTVLILFGLFFLYTGITSFLRPAAFASSLGLTTMGRSGDIEIRARYGGFFFVTGIVQFLPFLGTLEYATVLTVDLIIFAGLIVGRLLALLCEAKDKTLIPLMRALYLIDGIGTALAIIGLYFASQIGVT